MGDTVFDARSEVFKRPFGAVASDTELIFKVRLPRGAATRVRLMIGTDPGHAEGADLAPCGSDGPDEVYALSFAAGEAGLYFYWFEVETPAGSAFISDDAHSAGGLSRRKAKPFQQSVFDPGYKTPDWLSGGVMYQIFPDRFCRSGGPDWNRAGDRKLIGDWGGVPPMSGDDGYCSDCFFGGNLAGIEEKLPYLKSLGVTAIYLNPIFEAPSYHRYNTADYMKLDPLLGTDGDFRRLCEKARESGMGVILDGVFSHTGADSVYFNRYGRYPDRGAFQSKDSPYFSWYGFEIWPDLYRCWWEFRELPELNGRDPDFLEFLTGEGGVVRHWLELGAKGWRLDVADELPDKLIERLRLSVKAAGKENAVIGEVWEDASNKISYGERRHYLEGRQLDSVMNYPWRSAIINYITGGEAGELDEAVMSILENYPKETVDVLMNVLGSHDTMRLITSFAGESPVAKSFEWKRDTRLTPEQRELGLVLVRLASAVQYLLPGFPCVYYGDEAGFEGYEDPFNRLCYMWGEEDAGLVGWYRRLGALRRACPALKTGAYRTLAARGGLFSFERREKADAVAIALNSGTGEERTAIPGKLLLSYGGAKLAAGEVILPPQSCAVMGSGPWAAAQNAYLG